jgi:hypothetical protein
MDGARRVHGLLRLERHSISTTDELVQWGLRQAEVLEQEMAWTQVGISEYWTSSPSAKPRIRARAIAALDFLERFSGHDSQWAIRGHKVFDENRDSMESGARALGDVLREWAAAVTAGMVVPRQVEAQGARAVASIDLMEQVRVLAEDRTVHPAAPIVLAGAALEVALRSAVDELQLTLKERPSITAYARRLRTEGILSQQDVKDVEQMSGLRNSAAHGQFEELSRERSGLMEQQVNLFLARLSKVINPAIER